MINKSKEILFMIKNPNPTDITLSKLDFTNQQSSSSGSESELTSSNPDLFSNSLEIDFLYFEPIEKYARKEESLNKIYVNDNLTNSNNVSFEWSIFKELKNCLKHFFFLLQI